MNTMDTPNMATTHAQNVGVHRGGGVPADCCGLSAGGGAGLIRL